jgi:hypothetical protein
LSAALAWKRSWFDPDQGPSFECGLAINHFHQQAKTTIATGNGSLTRIATMIVFSTFVHPLLVDI